MKQLFLSIQKKIMVSNASYIQKEIFNLIQDIKSENELNEIKSLLATYLSDRVVREADKALTEKGYSSEIFDKWKNEHFRKHAM
ncbi:MAG: hypothetical protein M3R72_00910 [Bacteroidota bacterium]|nr:hypothetical protein [Bacteroidota bacterium]